MVKHALEPARGRIAGVAAALALLALAPLPVPALDWVRNDLRILYGAGFELGSERRTSVSFQHLSGWRYGDTFGFGDVIARDDLGAEYYGELYSWLSVSKLTGRDTGFGPLEDFGPGVAFNLGGEPFDDDFLAWLAGGKVVLDVPFLDYFELQVFAYKADGVDSVGSQITPVWLRTFALGRTRMIFRGYVDFISADATGAASTIFSQPELLIDVGHWWGETDRLLAGLRWQYSRSKFGIEDVDEDAPQLMLSWTF